MSNRNRNKKGGNMFWLMLLSVDFRIISSAEQVVYRAAEVVGDTGYFVT